MPSEQIDQIHMEQTRIEASQEKGRNYRPEIDGIRALAVIAVLINHFNKDLLPSGYLGVDIFFVISGYVITVSLASRQYSSFKDFILGFYSRRVKRLVPALVVCVFITCLVGYLFIPLSSDLANDSSRTGIVALFGLSNLYLFMKATDYFGASAELNLFTQTWSLGVEEQFYFLFPALIWFTGFAQKRKNGARNLSVGISALCTASLAMFIYWSYTNQPAAYFLLPSRFWEMGAGCLLFICLEKFPRQAINFPKNSSIILIFLLISILFVPPGYQVYTTIAAVALSALLIGMIRPATSAYRVLTLRPIIFIGLISYSLYLWHWSVLVISRWTIGISWWSAPVLMLFSILLAYLSYKTIEKPVRGMQRKIPSRLVFLSGFGCALVTSGFLFSVGEKEFPKLYLGTSSSAATVSRVQKGQGTLIEQALQQADRAAVIARANKNIVDCNMTPYQLRGTDYRPKPTLDENFFRSCLSSSKNKVVLVGDSFAQVIGPHMALAAFDIGYDFKTVIGYGCPYPLDKRNIPSSSTGYCEISSTLIKKALQDNLQPGDVLALRLYFSKNQYIRLPSNQDMQGLAIYDQEILSLYEIARSKGAALLVVGSNQTSQSQPRACLYPEWFNAPQRMTGDCNRIQLDDSTENKFILAHNQHLESLLPKGRAYLSVVEPLSVLCEIDKMSCLLENENHSYMFDDYHITQAAIDRLYPLFKSKLSGLISGHN